MTPLLERADHLAAQSPEAAALLVLRVLAEVQHRAEGCWSEEERHPVTPGACRREVGRPAKAQLPDRASLPQPERPALTDTPRFGHADLRGPAEAEGREAQVNRPGDSLGGRAEVARRAAEPARSTRGGSERQRSEDEGEHESSHQATAASAFSSSPNFARATNCPTPGEATSSSPSTSTWPRRSTTSGLPVTSVPS